MLKYGVKLDEKQLYFKNKSFFLKRIFEQRT